MAISFELLKTSSRSGARRGRLTTPHGTVETPAFMPVGTQGAVRGMLPRELKEMGVQILLGNTLHLYLRPGVDLIQRAGGLHRFMNWEGAILTDSGGFQVFSLAHLRRLSDDGVLFRSPIDGSEHFLSPERVVEIQEALGSDIAMPLDVCLGYPADEDQAREELRRTLVWAERSRRHHRAGKQALFAIVQGGFSPSLRREAAVAVASMDFPGYGIGGLSVGEPHELTYALTEVVTEVLPPHRPRYLMGVGSPPGIVEAVARGVDLFDCVLPTRVARTGVAFTRRGRINLRNAAYREDFSPLDPSCTCEVCRTYTRAYLRHLFKVEDMLGPRLTTYHNLSFLSRLTEEIRGAIAEDSFEEWKEEFLRSYTTPW